MSSGKSSLAGFFKWRGTSAKKFSELEFEKLYYEKSAKIKRQIFFLVGKEDYEDLLQEVFFKIYNKKENFKGKSSLDSWIYRLTFNTCMDHLRKKRPTLNSESFTEESVVLDVGLEQRDLIQKALNELSEKHREVFILFYVYEFKITEISEQLKISSGTVKSRLSESRKRIKKYFEINGVSYE